MFTSVFTTEVSRPDGFGCCIMGSILGQEGGLDWTGHSVLQREARHADDVHVNVVAVVVFAA